MSCLFPTFFASKSIGIRSTVTKGYMLVIAVIFLLISLPFDFLKAEDEYRPIKMSEGYRGFNSLIREAVNKPSESDVARHARTYVFINRHFLPSNLVHEAFFERD